MKRLWWLRGLRFALFALIALGVAGAVVMSLWNWLLPSLFGWHAIDFWQALGLLVFANAGVAETRRLPFDLPEAESELVAGYHAEYSAMKFGLFFVGEYLGIMLISAMVVTLFFGGWLGPWLPPIVWFVLKTFVLVCGFILLRATLPRPRFDQLMAYGWKVLLPLALVNLLVTGALVVLA